MADTTAADTHPTRELSCYKKKWKSTTFCLKKWRKIPTPQNINLHLWHQTELFLLIEITYEIANVLVTCVLIDVILHLTSSFLHTDLYVNDGSLHGLCFNAEDRLVWLIPFDRQSCFATNLFSIKCFKKKPAKRLYYCVTVNSVLVRRLSCSGILSRLYLVDYVTTLQRSVSFPWHLPEGLLPVTVKVSSHGPTKAKVKW